MKTAEVHNDAHLVQRVRSSLGRNVGASGTARINVSSCKSVVTLHGAARDPVECHLIGEAVKRVAGVRGVDNKLSLSSNRS